MRKSSGKSGRGIKKENMFPVYVARYYLDTAIWRDYYENRSDKFRPIGEWAFALLQKIQRDEHVLFYSDFIDTELLRDFSPEAIKAIFEIVERYTYFIKLVPSKNQNVEAGALGKKRGVGFGDALHAILARDNDAILVSRDNHFSLLDDIVITKKPEDLI